MSDELPGVVGVNNYRFLHLKKKSASFAFQKSWLSRCSTIERILETTSRSEKRKPCKRVLNLHSLKWPAGHDCSSCPIYNLGKQVPSFFFFIPDDVYF